MNKDVNIALIEERRQPIGRLGSNLGGAYFTTGAKETWPKFDEKKMAIERAGNNDLILNRSPRRYEIRDHVILSQAVETNAAGVVKVVFNPGTEDEAKASVIAGAGAFGMPTEDAVKDALRGENRIFVDGPALCKRANEYNQDEVDRLTVLIDALVAQRNAIKSTMTANTKKAEAYVRSIVDSTPKVVGKDGDSVAIVVEKADEE